MRTTEDRALRQPIIFFDEGASKAEGTDEPAVHDGRER